MHSFFAAPRSFSQGFALVGPRFAQRTSFKHAPKRDRPHKSLQRRELASPCSDDALHALLDLDDGSVQPHRLGRRVDPQIVSQIPPAGEVGLQRRGALQRGYLGAHERHIHVLARIVAGKRRTGEPQALPGIARIKQLP